MSKMDLSSTDILSNTTFNFFTFISNKNFSLASSSALSCATDKSSTKTLLSFFFLLMVSIQKLYVIEYIHVENFDLPLNLDRFKIIFMNISCVASSALASSFNNDKHLPKIFEEYLLYSTSKYNDFCVNRYSLTASSSVIVCVTSLLSKGNSRQINFQWFCSVLELSF